MTTTTQATKRQRAAQTLTDQDRASAIETILATDPRFSGKLGSCTDRNKAFELTIDAFYRNHVPPWQYDRKGEASIIAKPDGFHVTRDGRRGIVRYIDVVNEACDFEAAPAPIAIKNGNNIPTQINGHAGRFGEKSTSLPDGAAAIELTNGHRPKQPAGLGKLTEVENVPTAAQLLEISTLAINPNPWQPRQDFPKAEIESFAAQITADGGLIEPIVLRLTPGTVNIYQLVDGERRLRAAKHLKWPSILAVVREYSDQQMQALALSANDARKDLNPLERALAYQAILDARGLQPAALEAITGKSQSFISNHLRLLKLPKQWQDRVVAGDLTLTHVRGMMPFVKSKPIMASFEEQYRSHLRYDDTISANKFQKCVIDYGLRGTTEDIDREFYSQKTHRYVKPPKLSAEQLAQLDLIEVPNPKGKGKPQRLTTNRELLNKFRGKDGSTDEGDEKPTGAKKKRAPTAAEEKARAKKRAEQFTNHLSEWKANWLRLIISRRLVTGAKGDDETMFRLGLWIGTQGIGRMWLNQNSDELLEEAVESATGKKIKTGRYGYVDPWPSILAVEADKLPEVFMQFVRSLLWRKTKDGEQASPAIDDDDIFDLAKFLNINLAAEWKERKAGPLTEAFYNLFDKASLAKMPLADGLVYLGQDQSKNGLVQALVKQGPTKLPKELAAAK
jgi:ParB family chromosome partitioning protein